MKTKNNYCSKCGGPVTLKLQIDSLGNRIQSVRCWNGHYEELTIKDINNEYTVKDSKSKDVFPVAGFFSAR